MRLDKFVSQFASSRGEAKKLIKNGKISVNGKPEKDAGFIISEADDCIELDGERLVYRKYIYIMMNKPAGVVSATEDNLHETVTDLLPEEYRRFGLFPVGRLDIDTEGLILLTNDGQTAHRLLSPAHKVPKRYTAVLDGGITDGDIKKFAEGIVLSDGSKTKPAALEEISGNTVSVTITEGKFHQVKRMFADIGRKVKYLKRTEFASLTLDEGLTSGQWRELSAEEMGILEKIMQ